MDLNFVKRLQDLLCRLTYVKSLQDLLCGPEVCENSAGFTMWT